MTHNGHLAGTVIWQVSEGEFQRVEAEEITAVQGMFAILACHVVLASDRNQMQSTAAIKSG